MAYGAIGDGSTDDTNTIQNAINAAAAISGVVYFATTANGYRVTRTLTYTNTSPGTALSLLSAGRAGRGIGRAGPRIFWDGAIGGTLIEFTGANNVLIRNLQFDGRFKALYVMNFLYNAQSGTGSSGIKMENLHVAGASGPHSALVKIGNSNFQVSEIWLDNVLLQGAGNRPSDTYYGFWTQNANVKNFTLVNTQACGNRYGVTHGDPRTSGGGSGFLNIIGGGFCSNTTGDVYTRAGNTNMIGIGSEGSTMLLTGGSGSAGENNQQITIQKVSPLNSSLVVGNTATLTAVVQAGDGTPVSGATVTFSVSGANPSTADRITDTSGVASFSTPVGTSVPISWSPRRSSEPRPSLPTPRSSTLRGQRRIRRQESRSASGTTRPRTGRST